MCLSKFWPFNIRAKRLAAQKRKKKIIWFSLMGTILVLGGGGAGLYLVVFNKKADNRINLSKLSYINSIGELNYSPSLSRIKTLFMQVNSNIDFNDSLNLDLGEKNYNNNNVPFTLVARSSSEKYTGLQTGYITWIDSRINFNNYYFIKDLNITYATWPTDTEIINRFKTLNYLLFNQIPQSEYTIEFSSSVINIGGSDYAANLTISTGWLDDNIPSSCIGSATETVRFKIINGVKTDITNHNFVCMLGYFDPPTEENYINVFKNLNPFLDASDFNIVYHCVLSSYDQATISISAENSNNFEGFWSGIVFRQTQKIFIGNVSFNTSPSLQPLLINKDFSETKIINIYQTVPALMTWIGIDVRISSYDWSKVDNGKLIVDFEIDASESPYYYGFSEIRNVNFDFAMDRGYVPLECLNLGRGYVDGFKEGLVIPDDRHILYIPLGIGDVNGFSNSNFSSVTNYENIDEVYFSDTVRMIDAFHNCSSAQIKKVYLNNVQRVINNSFQQTSVEWLDLGSRLYQLTDGCFQYCSYLRTIIGHFESNPLSQSSYAFSNSSDATGINQLTVDNITTDTVSISSSQLLENLRLFTDLSSSFVRYGGPVDISTSAFENTLELSLGVVPSTDEIDIIDAFKQVNTSPNNGAQIYVKDWVDFNFSGFLLIDANDASFKMSCDSYWYSGTASTLIVNFTVV